MADQLKIQNQGNTLASRSGAVAQLPPAPTQSDTVVDLRKLTLPETGARSAAGGSPRSSLATETSLSDLTSGKKLSESQLVSLTRAEGLRIMGPNSSLSPDALARVGFSHLAETFKSQGNMRALRAMESFPLANDTERAYVLQPGIDHRKLGIPSVA